MTKLIKITMIKKNINHKLLAEKLNCSTTNLSNKFKRDNFSVNELKQIADALDCELQINFIDR